jgi:DMSO/TMAO reductase YedYZ molybdopterin-dependent catalytic subunit
MLQTSNDPPWVHGHPHDPNPSPPTDNPAFTVFLPNGDSRQIEITDLQALPFTQIGDCYIVSTGHGTSGPFVFGGARLQTVIEQVWPAAWRHADIHSADGFGARLLAAEVQHEAQQRPILLAYQVDGAALTRERGLVRLIVPSETDDALRQVKWVERIDIY